MRIISYRACIGGRLRARPAATLLLLAAAFVCFCQACREASSVPRLTHAAASQEALAQEVLLSLKEENLQEMKDLSLSKEEFRRFVWHELPVSNPKTNVPLDYVWNDLNFRSMTRMQGTFNRLMGKDLELVRVVHHGKVVEYSSHRAYPDMEVVIREKGGEEMSYPLFGTLIEMDGLWKVYSYAPYD